MKPKPTTDPTGYRAIYDRLVRWLPGATRPTKAEFAKAILRDRRLYRLFVVTSADLWVDQQQTVGDGRGDYRRRPTERRQT
jgi:hypothetical protein